MKGMPKRTLCDLLGISRQKYYRACWTEAKRKAGAIEVISMVQQERRYQPRVGGRKLYFMLNPRLRDLNGQVLQYPTCKSHACPTAPFLSYNHKLAPQIQEA